jgi:hypothetical protein
VSVTCYPSPGKLKGLKVCHAFAQGCGGQVAQAGETRLAPGPAFFYGMTAHSLALIARCRAEGRDWYYADNAYYVGRGSHFRVTKNAFQHAGTGAAGPERWRAFGVALKPWCDGGSTRRPVLRSSGAAAAEGGSLLARRSLGEGGGEGGHILITTQSELFYRLHLGVSRAAWLADLRSRLKAVSGRPIEVCHKPAPGAPGNPAAGENFEADLTGAHALVTHSSSTAVKALIEGVPVFCLGVCVASPLGLSDPARIETPHYPGNREPWLWTLAANQWTREEMRAGVCWRDLNGLR